ncbi:MAG: type II toxin-antitoxin system VapC family toxin [Alphaproteobacteria bacterium]|nr:type II toxin-antitoxin system VapC family toxin [Alphaproteobacteria bacterium]
MSVLLDTCVLSEVRRLDANPAVRDAVEACRGQAFISVISIGELAKGIAMLPGGRRKANLARWLDGIEKFFDDRILAVDRVVARKWGEFTADAARKGRALDPSDGKIAATAAIHGMTVMTRNVRDFEFTGVPLLNPWRLQ